MRERPISTKCVDSNARGAPGDMETTQATLLTVETILTMTSHHLGGGRKGLWHLRREDPLIGREVFLNGVGDPNASQHKSSPER